MAYSIELTPAARRDIKKLPKAVLRRVDAAILLLKDHPRPPKAVKLKGKLRDYHRVTVGAFRVIYSVNDKELVICVARIRPRKEAYR